MKEYLDAGESDSRLSSILEKFQNLYPYLAHIAHVNGIRDPFDDRVVEAYWIGNRLLEVAASKKYFSLLDELDVKKKSGRERFDEIGKKVCSGGLPHHSFHVLNIWNESGHEVLRDGWHALAECLVSWGKVISVSGPYIDIQTELLTCDKSGVFALGAPTMRRLVRSLAADIDIDLLIAGQWIAVHWGAPCEVLSEEAVRRLRRYTLRSIDFANKGRKI